MILLIIYQTARVECNGVRANAKSILGILILAIEPGAEVIIEANGPDEKEAIEKIDSLIARKFGLE